MWILTTAFFLGTWIYSPSSKENTRVPLPHCGHEDVDPLYLLRALTTLVLSLVDKLESHGVFFPLHAVHCTYAPRLHSAFSFLAFGHCMPVSIQAVFMYKLYVFITCNKYCIFFPQW